MAESSVYRPTKSCFGQSFYQTCFGQSSAAQEENVSVTVLALFLCSAKQRRDNERQFWSGQTRLCQRKESNRDCCPIFTVGLLDRLWLWCAVVHLYECRRRTAPPVLRFFQKDVFKKPTLTSSTGAAGFLVGGLEFCAQEFHDRFDVVRLGLRCLAGRHFAQVELIKNPLPDF